MIKVKDIVKNCSIYVVEDKIVDVKIFDYDIASVSFVDGNTYRISYNDAQKIIDILEKKVS